MVLSWLRPAPYLGAPAGTGHRSAVVSRPPTGGLPAGAWQARRLRRPRIDGPAPALDPAPLAARIVGGLASSSAALGAAAWRILHVDAGARLRLTFWLNRWPLGGAVFVFHWAVRRWWGGRSGFYVQLVAAWNEAASSSECSREGSS